MSLPQLAVKHPVFVTCIMLFIFFTGLESFKGLPVGLFPKADVPFITISTVYPGAGPKDVESAVTKPIEDEIAALEGLKNVRSKSQDSLSLLVLEFKMGSATGDVMEQRVRNSISLAKAKFPKEVQEPIISKYDPSNQPVVTLFVTSALKSRMELSSWVDDELKPLLARTPKVGKIEILGEQKRQIKIIGDHQKLDNFRLPLLSISKAIKNEGENVPGGSVQSGSKEINVRTLGQYNNLSEIENTILRFANFEKPIRVKDVAKVIDSTEKERSRSFLGEKQGLALNIFKQSEANTIEVAKAIKKEVDKFNKTNPQAKDYSIEIVEDGSKLIHDSIYDVWESIIIGFILTILVVYFFLGSLKSTVITGLAIPNSILGAFLLMAIAGFSINILTLLALSLSVGLLVDDGIVVRENIFRYLELGAHPKKAAIIGAKEVTLAVMASTLAILAIFGPVGFLKGVTGQFFREFGLVVCFAMIISFFDGMAIAPMLSAYWADKTHPVKKLSLNPFRSIVYFVELMQIYFENLYKKLLNFTLKFPLSTIFFVVTLAVLTAFPVTKLTSGFLPTDQSNEFNIQINLPAGTNLDKTTITAKEIDKRIRSKEFVDYTFLTVGNSYQEMFTAKINVHLKSSYIKSHKVKPSYVRELVKQDLEQITNLPSGSEVIVVPFDIAARGERAFGVMLQTNNYELLKPISDRILEKVKKVKALSSPNIDIKVGADELQVDLKTDAAQKLGIDTFSVGQEIRGRIEGVEVGKLRDKWNETKIFSTTNDPASIWLERKQEILVPNINYIPIDLRKVAKFNIVQGPSVLRRYNRSYAAKISADIASNGGGLSTALKEVREIINEEVKNDPSLKYSFIGDSESYEELTSSMAQALLFGIVFLFLVLASLYESFLTSFLNIATLPLAVSGAFLGLFLFHEDLNLYSMIGILMLLGVATKNSILLIDTANEKLKTERENLSKSELIHFIQQASVRRLRPIFMTSLALIAGSIPIAVGLNEASAQRTSMGVAIIGGVISSTLFSLILVPSLLLIVEMIRNFRVKLKK
jgi:HAE1 family hydrophobic/amphiphilic exporter-1